MYNCATCGRPSKPGQARLVHNLYKPRLVLIDGEWKQVGKDIAKELHVCSACKVALDSGVPLNVLAKSHDDFTVPQNPNGQTRTAQLKSGLKIEKKLSKFTEAPIPLGAMSLYTKKESSDAK